MQHYNKLKFIQIQFLYWANLNCSELSIQVWAHVDSYRFVVRLCWNVFTKLQ